jgi:glycosyltransferase involved in cell wall biosynthesis
MSIYHKENPEYFDRCMQSILDEQTIKADEIVLVEDGELTNELYSAIGHWKKKLGETLKVMPLERNVGLGDALNMGLVDCSHEIVARMDTDDVASPDRFAKQLKIFESDDIDICSSWVSEFDKDEKKIVSYRKVPESHDEIVEFAKTRNPLNHPAVMYRKSAVEAAGGYQKMMWFEDYYLWARMIMNGARFYNIQEPLVHMRAGYGQLERRSGWKYAKAEIQFLKKLKNIGFLSNWELVRNASTRVIARILPKIVVKAIYRAIRG